MSNKKATTLILTIFCATFLLTGCFSKKNIQSEATIQDKQEIKDIIKPNVTKPKSIEKKYDLYSSTIYDIPLFSIVEISKLPLNIKNTIDTILENSQGIYLLRLNNDKIIAILQNPIQTNYTYQRHNLQIIEIDFNEKIAYHNAGYSGEDGEIFNSLTDNKDLWLFDETIEPFRPLKHVAYDEKNKVKFTEYWNYDNNDPIKYQMLDNNKKIVSILKETQSDDFNTRREHIFYDNNGVIKMSFSVNYNGANISHLNYYNSHDSIESISIDTEYLDGNKTKETIYDENFSLKYTVQADYQDNERKCIKIFDSENNNLMSISS